MEISFTRIWEFITGQRRSPNALWYALAAILLAAMSSALWFAYRDNASQLTRSYQMRTNQQVGLATQQVDLHINHIFGHLSSITNQPGIASLNESGKEQMDSLLQLSQPWGLSITRISPDLKILYSVPQQEVVGADVSSQAHNVEMALDPRPVVSSPFDTVQGYRAISVAVPVFQRGQFDGSLSVLLDQTQLTTEFVDPVNPEDIATMLVLDNNGAVISYPGLKECASYEDVFADNPAMTELCIGLLTGTAKNRTIKNHGMIPHLPDHEGVVVASSTTSFASENNWHVCALVPHSAIMAISPNAKWPYLVAALYAVSILALALAIISLSYRYRRQLEQEVRKQTFALRESEERYRYLVEKMGEGIALTDSDDNIQYANAALAEMLGEPPGDLTGRKLAGFVPESDRPQFEEIERDALAGEIRSTSLTLISNDGQERVVSYSCYPRLSDDGQPLGKFALVSDITERSLIEKTLDEERQLFTEGLVVTYKWAPGDDWNVDYISPNISQFGYSPDTIISGRRKFWDIVHPDDQPKLRHASVEADKRGLDSFQLEYRIVTPANQTRWVLDYTKILRNAEGQVTFHLGYITDITRRKLAEEGLVKQQVELQAITRAFPDLYFRQDASGDFLDFISSGKEDAEQPLHFLGKEHFKMMPHHVVEKLNMAMRKVIQTRKLQSVEYSLNLAKQQQFFEARLVPMEGNQVLGIVRNITERKRGELVQEVLLDIAEAATHTEDLRDLLAEIHRHLGRLIQVDNFYVALFNEDTGSYEFPFHIDERDEDFGPQPLPNSLTEYVRKTGKALYSDSITHKRLAQEGEIELVGPMSPVWMGAPLTAGGKVIGVVAVQDYHDARAFTPRDLELLSYVTEHVSISINRKSAEEALRKSEESYRRLVEVANESIISVDDREVITFANSAFCEALSYDREEVIGRSILELVSSDSLQDVLTGTDLRRMGRSSNYELSFIAADGSTVDFLATATPLNDEAGKYEGSLAVMVDITERKAASEAMLQTQKLESLGVMAGGIAHDFNNLLVGILGNAGLALSELPETSPAYQYIQDLERASQRAADLTRQMLAYSGKGKMITAPFEISEVVEEMSRLLKAVIPKSVALELDLTDNLPMVNGDVAQFRQVVMNLIINAAEAIGEGAGNVNVSTGMVKPDWGAPKPDLVLDETGDGDYVFVEVTDTGSGMTQSQLEKVFDPFFTTKFTGRGLGLAVVLGIVRSHSGTIKVNSKPGRGTTFKVLLPVSKAHKEAEDPDDSGAISWSTSGTVLVVDDEPSIRTVTKRILAQIGMDAILARDGLEGVQLFSEKASTIDLVILDLTMPQMSGEEALQKMREIRPDIKVLLTSGYSEQDAVSRFADDSLAGFLQKPYTMNELVVKIREVLELRRRTDVAEQRRRESETQLD